MTSYDDVLTSVQSTGRLPSVVAAVARAGRPVWHGCINVMPDVPATSASSYRIGSITKTLTAVLVMQLRDEGLFGLDDPLSRFVPEAGYGMATVRQLLSHTSGMQSEPYGPWWERVDGGSFEELLAANDGSGRVAGSGETYHYSNLGFALLGEAVARLRGTTWWEVVHDRLLAPLGMTETAYQVPIDHAPGRSVDHFAHTLSAEPHTDTGAMAPAGQLWSTTRDLLRWADFLAQGHPDVLAAATLDEMAVPSAPATAYGLGLRLVTDGKRTLVGHTGSMPGFQASLFVDRTTRDAAVVLTNATTGLESEQVGLQLLAGNDDVAPSSIAARWHPSNWPVPSTVLEVLGVWFWGNSGFALEWTRGELWARDLRNGDLDERFVPAGDGFLGVDGYHAGETLHLRRRADGSVSHLECATFIWTRMPYDPTVPIPGGPAPQA